MLAHFSQWCLALSLTSVPLLTTNEKTRLSHAFSRKYIWLGLSVFSVLELGIVKKFMENVFKKKKKKKKSPHWDIAG